MDRRTFLGGAIVLVCAPPWVGCSDDPAPGTTSLDGWQVPPGTKLSPERFATLAAVMDTLIPGDESSPGATLAHAAWYADQLLGAFDVDPPRIFAGGPYSGRHGGLDGFTAFLPLTRIEELTWRTRIEGSKGLPEREWNGPVKGYVTRYEEGLDAIQGASQTELGRGFRVLSLDDRRSRLSSADAAFVKLAYQHAVEGTYGDPAYGGNFEQAGWRSIGYEGDRHPLGFHEAQLLNPEETGW